LSDLSQEPPAFRHGECQFEDDAEKYASPDASALRSCADMLAEGVQPVACWSEWGSGGYQPYNSTEGRREHDELVAKLQELGK
jgi:hypothetical protein